jgi:hypothetical protein
MWGGRFVHGPSGPGVAGHSGPQLSQLRVRDKSQGVVYTIQTHPVEHLALASKLNGSVAEAIRTARRQPTHFS